jgi:hypothetical protein
MKRLFLFFFFLLFINNIYSEEGKIFHHYFMAYIDAKNQFFYYDYKLKPFLLIGIRYWKQNEVERHQSFDFFVRNNVYYEEAKIQYTPKIDITLFYFPFIDSIKWYNKIYGGLLVTKSETEKQIKNLFPLNGNNFSGINTPLSIIQIENQYFISIEHKEKNLYGMGMQLGYRWEWNLSKDWGFFIDVFTGVISYFPYKTALQVKILPLEKSNISINDFIIYSYM